MFLALELFVVAATLACALHAKWQSGTAGLRFFLSLLWLGVLRESLVGIEGLLYRFSSETLPAGPAPLIAVIIWAFSIYVAVVWAALVDPKAGPTVPAGSSFGWRRGLMIGAFMIALAGFYEPLLEQIGMARWEPGTVRVAGVPIAALLGYPTLTWLALAAWSWTEERIERPRSRYAVLFALIPVLAAVHAMGLQAVKSAFGW